MRDVESHYPIDVTGKPAVINVEDEPEHEASQQDTSSGAVCHLCQYHVPVVTVHTPVPGTCAFLSVAPVH